MGQYFHCFPPAHYHDKSTKPPYDLSKELNRLHIPKEELQNTSCFQLSCQYTKYIHSFLTLQQHHSMRSFCAALFNCRDYRFKLVEANAFSGMPPLSSPLLRRRDCDAGPGQPSVRGDVLLSRHPLVLQGPRAL